MVQVHVWNFLGSKRAWGHASLHVGTTYISWWPGPQEDREYKLGRELDVYSVPHIFDQTFEDDQELEGRPGHPRPPDHTIGFSGLDEPRILDWWKAFGVEGRAWSTLGQNCSTTVGRALMVGGGDDYAEGLIGWWHSWNMVWQPADVLRYAQSIERGLRSAGDRWFAINFLRRFTRSPLAMTSLTLSMDERGLATALFDEYGADARRVEEVFRELDEYRNSYADDAAEVYVNILKQRGGAPLEAVKRSPALRERLIKVLNEGWTSAGKQKCIDFLKQSAGPR
jgi:hypothetical protein